MSKFFFGASLAAHQVEGNNKNSDWWKFEQEILSKKGITSGLGTDHYNRFDEDFRLAKEMGHNSHRFSIEWARIEPEEGVINKDAIKHYKKVFQSLKKHRLQPFVTLFHFTMPLWFAEKGGFEKLGNIKYFTHYVEIVGKEFREEMEYIMTMNEPEIFAYHSYLIGKWPPQQKSYLTYRRVFWNLTKFHIEAFKVLKKINPHFKVGVAKNNQLFTPEKPANFLDNWFTNYLCQTWNHYFLKKIHNHIDFIGLNYYFYRGVKVRWKFLKEYFQHPYHTTKHSDMGWEIFPKGIYYMIKDLARLYKKPILVTENGVADKDDKLRSWYLEETFKWLYRAKKEGAPLIGYLHWALTDNFEWDSGYVPCFGLIAIDYKNNFARKPRRSAKTYRKLIEKYTELM